MNGDPRQAEGSRSEDASGSKSKISLWTKAKQLWLSKTGINWLAAKLMLKGALPATIVLAAYRSNAWASQYSTIGYLIGVLSQLSVSIQPRARFMQTILVHVFLTCLFAAINLLCGYTVLCARLNTGGGVGPVPTSLGHTPYNSSASAVSAVWLFFEIYSISVVRAKFPQYSLPCISAAIVANVAMSYAPQFTTLPEVEELIQALLLAMLTGMAVATGVSLFVFPVTCRQFLFNDMTAYIGSLRAALGANQAYLNSLEYTDMFATRTRTEGQHRQRSPEAAAFLGKAKIVSGAHAKCAANMPFAKREIAFGKLGPDDLQQIFTHLRQISVAMTGLSCLPDIFERTSEERGWDRSKSFSTADIADATNEVEKARIESIKDWHELISLLKEPFGRITNLIDEGLEHAAIVLQFQKGSKKVVKEQDNEASGDSPTPGDQNFAAYLDSKVKEFAQTKRTMLRGWCRIHGVELPDDFFTNPNHQVVELPKAMNEHTSPERIRVRRQLMIILYEDFLLYDLGRKTHGLVKLADELRESGKLKKTRLIVPGIKILRKWFQSAFHAQDLNDDDYSDSIAVYLGQAYKKRKDPEHLPPRNFWEKFSNLFRIISHFFASAESEFAFRCAVATLSIAIINYLKVSQVFFTEQRLFWAQIMTSIGMSPSSGQSLRQFFFRILGTFIAMILAMLAYYIVDKKIAGVIVFFYLFQLPGLYIMVKHPLQFPAGLIQLVTLALILGYELQVRKIGLTQSAVSGQEYWPVYILAPIRVVTVIAGLFVAWVFTIFPYPVTEHSQLRKNMASTLYLLANYYSIIHQTIHTRLKGGIDADESVKGSPAHKMAKERFRVFSKCSMLLSGMRTQAATLKYDIPAGGRFPKEQYERLIEHAASILNFVALMSVASSTYTELDGKADEDHQYEWAASLRRAVRDAGFTSQTITNLLSLLSAALGHAQPLPPYLRIPEPYLLSERLQQIDQDLLSVAHIAEPGYASFAVIQIGISSLIDDLNDVLEGVKELVGELDFSFHIISTADPLSHDETHEVVKYVPNGGGKDDKPKED